MTITIRRASEADAELLSSLNADVQDLHATALPFRFKPPSGSFSPTEAATLIAHPNHLVFVAEVNSVPAGYAYAEIIHRAETAFTHAYDTVYLHHISVRPEYRRSGLGAALVAAVRSAAKEVGIELLTLDVWSFNKAARAFFVREGFVTYNERLWNRVEDAR
jgi:ribosomal protein S18 acetylase RimI-like enzyme